MKTVLIKAIKYLGLFQFVLLLLLLLSFKIFINAEVAFFSSLFIMIGSMYSYYSLVNKRLENYENMDEADLIDKIDDPYDLYGENSECSAREEEIDIKAVIKEEKQRLKANTTKNTISSAPAMVSLYRLIPYLFLVVGFIALKNNELLSLWPYLIGLGVGVIGGLTVGRIIFRSS
ncbi:MAG: hypothetical protein U9Q62_10380 [Campylobacterota bacterium]|nr:hypothetical protein [Campylobacterota bacterium]